MSTRRNITFPGACGNGLTISIPHFMKDHGSRIELKSSTVGVIVERTTVFPTFFYEICNISFHLGSKVTGPIAFDIPQMVYLVFFVNFLYHIINISGPKYLASGPM